MKRLLLSVLSIVPLTTVADNRAGQIVINPALSWQQFDDDRFLENGDGYGVGLEYRLGAHWAVEALGFQSKADLDLPGSNLEIELNQFKLDTLYYLTSGGTVQPYLGAGIGVGDFDLGRDDETQVNLGGGLRFRFSDAWSARWDLRGVHGLDDSFTDVMTTLGISLAFGGHQQKPEPKPMSQEKPVTVVVKPPLDTDADGVVDEQDQCPSTPKGVAVNAVGCPLDSDQDGVTDNIDQCPQTEPGKAVDAQGCVGETQTVAVESMELKIQFPTNSDRIPDAYLPELEKVADFLQEYADLRVEIAGYTDSLGQAEYNRRLSQKRADAVKQALVDRFQIDIDRVSAVGYGEDNPIASNDTPQGRQQNRRVVAVMQKEVIK